jgi:hypothetical protein
MIGKLLRGLLVRGSEMMLALGLVAVFALIFLATLGIVFPKGTGLVKIYGDILNQGGRAQRAAAGSALPGEETKRVVAVIAAVLRTVKDRPADAVAWTPSRVGTTIENGHAVQTLEGSSANLIVGDKSELTMGENSLVVFREAESGLESRAKRAALVLLGGQLLGIVGAAGTGTAPVDIVAGGATTQIRPRGSAPANFAVSVGADKTSTFSLYSGEAQLSASGRTLSLAPNQSVTVSPSGVASPPVRIPDPPRPVAPPDGWNKTFSAAAPQVEFRWDDAPGAERYRLVIAKDAAFTEVEHDQELTATRFVHGNLHPGTHHWRVTSLAGRVESKPGTDRTLTLDQDLVPPALHVEIPSEVVGTDRLVIHGTTEPGSQITIGGDKVATSQDGAFEYALVLKPGLNMVVIEATDAAGNDAFVSKYVNARF